MGGRSENEAERSHGLATVFLLARVILRLLLAFVQRSFWRRPAVMRRALSSNFEEFGVPNGHLGDGAHPFGSNAVTLVVWFPVAVEPRLRRSKRCFLAY